MYQNRNLYYRIEKYFKPNLFYQKYLRTNRTKMKFQLGKMFKLSKFNMLDDCFI